MSVLAVIGDCCRITDAMHLQPVGNRVSRKQLRAGAGYLKCVTQAVTHFHRVNVSLLCSCASAPMSVFEVNIMHSMVYFTTTLFSGNPKQSINLELTGSLTSYI